MKLRPRHLHSQSAQQSNTKYLNILTSLFGIWHQNLNIFKLLL